MVKYLVMKIFNDSMESNLLAHYKFNAGDKIFIVDHSGNQNHGNIYGATWFEKYMDALMN